MATAWSDYKEHARSKGVMGRELFMIHSVPVASADDLQATLPDHLAYQKKLEAEGVLFAAGPLADEAGQVWSMEGLIILRAESLDDARRIAAADPMHQSGKKTFTVRPWLVNEGRIQVDISLSSKSVRLP
ncbi:MAG: YciI family protein [Pseudomonadota bacterium]